MKDDKTAMDDALDFVRRRALIPNRMHPSDREALEQERAEESLAGAMLTFAKQYTAARLAEAEEKNKRLTEALEQTEELVKLIDVDDDGIYNIAREGKLIGYGGTAWDAIMSATGFLVVSTEESK